MLNIEIEIPRPKSLLFWGAIGVGFWMAFQAGASQGSPQGGNDTTVTAQVMETETDMREQRLRQQVLTQREEILREELEILEREMEADPSFAVEWEEARDRLVALLKDKHKAEQEIARSFAQLREAQAYAMQVSKRTDGFEQEVSYIWPVDPEPGLTALFDDEPYFERFKVEHRAVDIRAAQGTEVAAAADGIVVGVKDNGYGFNSVTIKHADGMATLYGHVSQFFVQEGEFVSAGQLIALSGGMPGTIGAGHMTTGPHLHFQMLKEGVPVDPLLYLPGH